ncbi:ubiquitin 3 binding protein But2 C-terminal domain-containing protein [Boeremia exigua]|uniref:ubiquitin 3 binding protein But2 C-terminal domain-containing protein n=1 Tax=Boeremia exigua TaxID=749465 RepID=UPI001E8EBC96|nr:ubiquitin 3 binding protein But2 C-terminal domain-containing protein [Boeremia exigua]KAH6639795.1 ubiquitin 3 binding protein But2 C-terminal domain-containing protein [Boeremia exigua]
MKYAFASVAFGLGANALVAREASQCVQLKASGGQSGVLGQLDDGQNRVHGGHPTGCYCLSNGGFTDSNGRGCILTPPTTQFQCDVGASPTTGFAVGSSGSITYNGSSKFYACPASDTEYNVYTTPVSGQDKCVEISLSSAGSCGAESGQFSAPAASQPAKSAATPQPSQPAPKPSQPAQSYPAQSQPAQSQPSPKPSQPAQSGPAPTPSQPTQSYPPQSQPAPKPSPSAQNPSQPAQSAPVPKPSAPAQSAPAPSPSAPAQSGNKCPTDLNGAYQFPHLIIPVDSEQSSKAFGTSYNGKVDSHTCSIFNFDIPTSYSGKTCSVVFLFPEQKDLETSSFTVSGTGPVSFTKLKGPASQQTTWANQPGKDYDLASIEITPGNSYSIASGDCAAGQTVSYEICSEGDFALDYFQDYNPSPLGLYVRQC